MVLLVLSFFFVKRLHVSFNFFYGTLITALDVVCCGVGKADADNPKPQYRFVTQTAGVIPQLLHHLKTQHRHHSREL